MASPGTLSAAGTGVRSLALVPVVKKGVSASIFYIVHASPRAWSADELQLLHEVAERTWTAIELARAEAALRVIEEWQVFLLRLSDALRPLDNPVEIQRGAVQLLAVHLGLDRAGYCEVDASGQRITIAQDYCAPGMPSFVGQYQLDKFGAPIVEAMRSGKTLVIDDVMTDARLADLSGQETWQATSTRAAISTPLIKDGELRAVLFAHQRSPRQWTEHEIVLVDEVAERTWAAVERARAESAMRESEERLRAIVEEATDYAIFTSDIENRITTWLPGAQAVFGWTPDEAIGELVDITFTPEDRAAGEPQKEFQEARANGVALNVRWHIRHDGSRVFIEGVARARHGPDGSFLGLLKIGQEVTQRREAEQARQAEEERLRAELEDQVTRATADLRTLSRRLLAVQEEERRHLARELHDEIGQMLTGLSLQLGSAHRVEASRLDEARRTVSELTEQVRQLSMDLRPATLDRYGLLSALQWHLERYEQRTGVHVELRHEGLERRFAAPVETTAYRVVQETLTNVARHSGSKSATVQLLADGSCLTVSIRDEGRGFTWATMQGGSGLGGMRERVELLGGTLTVDATPGQGVVITAEIPTDESPVDEDTS